MPNTADYLTQLQSDRNDLADNLVTMGVAASHSETITALVPKVLTIPSGSNIGYEVKFKSEGNDYYVAQCLQGDTISEPPTPTSQSGTFTAWQLNGTDVSFPYTPSADVELVAHFATVRTEMEINTTVPVLWEYNGQAKKTYNGTAICGQTLAGDWHAMGLIGESANDIAVTWAGGSIYNSTTKTYNGTTYYCAGYYRNNLANINDVFTNNSFGAFDSWDNLYTKILDHYFYND